MGRKKSAAKKAREEAERLKFEQENKEESEVEQSESSEDEDEMGDLLTESVESSIQKVLKTIKEDPEKLLDPETKFFEEEEVDFTEKPKDKALYIKDYQRQQLLSGDYKKEEDDGKSYVEIERDERNQLLNDINNAISDDEGDFLQKKEKPREIEETFELPNPDDNAEEFLEQFISKQAWIPRKDDKVVDLDQMDNEDEQEFDDAVEDLENAYNFRYEDPNAAEIVSYARNQATMRRGKTNARKKAREKKLELKEQEKAELETAVQKKKTAKLNKVIDRLAQIKEVVGSEVSDETIQKVFGDSLLNDDFEDGDWDSKMAEIFNESYYGEEVSKPKWDEDDELMAEFKEEKKSKKKEKREAKKAKKSIKEKAEQIVEANATRILDEVEEERGRNREDGFAAFKYREVLPESFGLSTRDILVADDLDLNRLVGLKKFAPYRDPELVRRDKDRYARSKNIRRWRRDVFKNRDGPERHPEEGENEIWIPVEPKKKKRKHA